jgi:hypothetical protein
VHSAQKNVSLLPPRNGFLALAGAIYYYSYAFEVSSGLFCLRYENTNYCELAKLPSCSSTAVQSMSILEIQLLCARVVRERNNYFTRIPGHAITSTTCLTRARHRRRMNQTTPSRALSPSAIVIESNNRRHDSSRGCPTVPKRSLLSSSKRRSSAADTHRPISFS